MSYLQTHEEMREEWIEEAESYDMDEVSQINVRKYGIWEWFQSKIYDRETTLVEMILPKVQKFIDKVESGRAKSKETYADMKEIRDFLSHLQDSKK